MMEKRLPFTKENVEKWTNDYPTPFYVYDEEGIRNTIKELNDAFLWNEGFREHFAVKATPTPGILRILEELECGTDCASIPEVEMSKRCGITGKRIVFTANEVLPEEYRFAYEAGAIINLDDVFQAKLLKSLGIVPDTIFVRYNPGKFVFTNSVMGNLYDSKFGMPKDQMIEALEIGRQMGVKHFGIHAMLASNCLEEVYYPTLAKELFTLALDVYKQTGIKIETLDFAGGIGIPYRPENEKVDIKKVGEGVKKYYEEIFKGTDLKPSIATELGRFMMGPHGYLITKAIGEKHIYKEYIGVDATAACLMRPAIYGAYHHITVVGKENVPDEIYPVDVVGSLCENNDKFAVDRYLPHIDMGDVLVIHDTGAHGHSMGYNYNGKLRPAEFLMKSDKSLQMIRRAQSMEDYFATLDIDPSFRTEK